ncbi:MAG: metal-dependent transcriptional regulator [Bacteroidota bacterium]
MFPISKTEENYLKAIFKLYEETATLVSTNAIAKEMNTKAASVTDMIQRLSSDEKKLIHYKKRKGVKLTEAGNKIATSLIRRHRLWETFLVEKLNFSWDEVHEIAEELEHIKAEKLIDRLDEFLGRPKFDPHGDPIPDAAGNFTFRKQILLTELQENQEGVVVGVLDDSPSFLQYLDKLRMVLGTKVKVLERIAYDGSNRILIDNQYEQILTNKVCQNLYVKVT